MISAESAIRALRRDLTVSSLLKAALLGAGLVCLLMGPIYGQGWPLTVAIFGILGIWLALSYRSAKGSSLAADSPLLIASGQFEEAEKRIEQALRGFSIFRSAKIISLHHLAVLRHTQHRWEEATLLCRAVLRQKLGALQPLARASQLMLADSLLEQGDLRGAYGSIMSLYDQRLTLSEALNLLLVQLDYESRIGAWASMTRNMMSKVQLAELMPSASAAKAQALLALAAQKTERDDWAQWLLRRVALLSDINALVIERPMLKELLSAA